MNSFLKRIHVMTTDQSMNTIVVHGKVSSFRPITFAMQKEQLFRYWKHYSCIIVPMV